LNGPGNSLGTGTVVLDLKKSLAEGNLSAECPELSSVSTLLGRDLQGKADLRVTLGGGERGVPLRLALEGRNLRGAFGEADELQLQGVLKDLTSLPQGSAKLQVKELRLKGVHVPVLELDAEGTGEHISFGGRAKGSLDRAFEVETAGLFSPNQDGPILRVDKLDGRYGDLPIRLIRAAVLERSVEGLSLRSAEFQVGGAPLSGAGRFGPQDMDVALKIENLPVDLLRPAAFPSLQGSLSGDLLVQGPLERPKGASHIRIRGLKVNDPQLEGIPPASLEAQVLLQEDWIRGEIVLRGLTSAPFVSRVEMPLRLSLAPFSVALPSGGEVKGSLSGKADIARVGGFMGLDDQSLGGVLDVGLQLGGTVEDPRITGGLGIEKGTYENLRTGTILRDIEMKIVARTPRLVIEQARGSDGEKGTLTMEGWLDASAEKGFPLQGTLVLQEARLARYDSATGTVNGRLHLEGSIRRPKLTGEIEITSADLKLPKRFSQDIPELEVVEIHGPGKRKGEDSAPPTSAGADMELDLSLRSPGRVFLSGRGLDSEWKGDLRITGTTEEPVITGGLSVIRGYFNFLDRRFNLEQGKITFNGMSPPSPFVDALAEASARDVTARLRLIGPLRSPDLKLSSDPPMPSDEVLSHLLFGRGVSSISPVQAIQLAQALNLLAGGNTFDLLGQTRRLLGVDQLEVKQSGERPEDTSVAAGKYLGNNVYLEVEKELGPKGPKASVNWEITPHLSIESELGTDEEGGIGLNWKWDY